MKYKNYYNFELGNRDIYSHNDILGMTVQDLFDNELPLSYQYNTIGIPKDDELINSPNTMQYTNANGKRRWRSSSKTTEDLIEEERQRRAALEAQNQAAQSQLSSIQAPSAPIDNNVKKNITPSPIDNQPLLNDNTIGAIGNFAGKMINKFKNRKQQSGGAIADAIDSAVNNEDDLQQQSPITRGIENSNKPNFPIMEKGSENPFDQQMQQDDLISNIEQPEMMAYGLRNEPMWERMLAKFKGRARQVSSENTNSAMLNNGLEGNPTGGAAPIDRLKENPMAKQNNDDFFENERQKSLSWLMRINAEKNKDRPDAKLFMDIALAHPKSVPSCKDYYFLSSKHVPELNKTFKLEGNKEIPTKYDGFKFSENSPTAQRLNASPEFKSEIFAPKNYDSKKGQFKSDKLEIELKNDKNLGYSFGHMTVLNPKITDDGYVVGWGYDMYNYEYHSKDAFSENKEAWGLNTKAVTLQTFQHLKPYYILVPIKVKI